MPIEHRDLVFEKYAEYVKQNAGKKGQQKGTSKQQKQEYTKPPEGISPMKLGLHRIDSDSSVGLTRQVELDTSQVPLNRLSASSLLRLLPSTRFHFLEAPFGSVASRKYWGGK